MDAIPQGYHTITPNLTIDGADKAIGLYQKALGATLDGRVPSPDGKKVMHAAMTVGDSKFFLNDPFPDMGHAPDKEGSPVGFYLYVRDCDKAFRKAVDAGMKETNAPQDMFWGDRLGTVDDPFGYRWTFATHVRDVSEEEIQQAMKAM